MSDAYDFFIAVSSQGPSEYVVEVTGTIDLSNAARLQEALLDGLIGTPTRLIVDLTAVSALDSSGLDVLVGAHRRSTAFGTELLFRHSNAELAHLLEHNGLPTAATTTDSPACVPADRQRRPYPLR